MTPIAFHLVFRTVGSRVIAPDVPDQRRLRTITHELGESHELLAFRASGDHLHVEIADDRASAGAFARHLGSALTQALDLPGFLPTYIKPCEGRDHLERTFFYILKNAEKHGVNNDPAHEASSIGALMGLHRSPSGFLPRVRGALPFLTRESLLPVLGVSELKPGFYLDGLSDAAAAVVGMAALDATREAFEARAAACRVAAGQAPPAAVAGALGVSLRAERRFRMSAPNVLLDRAVALRLGFMLALGERTHLDKPL